MKQEKQEESKKKREEKLKKIQEVKHKQEQEREEKRKELERQASATLLAANASKMTTSTSHTSIHKPGFLNSSVLTKKPFADQSTKLNVPSTNTTCKKLSAVDQEAISNFATVFGKYKQLQQQ